VLERLQACVCVCVCACVCGMWLVTRELAEQCVPSLARAWQTQTDAAPCIGMRMRMPCT
jgi:hypothetical protein